MNLRSTTYVTTKEARNRALDGETSFEDKNNITTNTNYDSEPDFDSSDDDIFDPILSSDYNTRDDFIDVDYIRG